MFDTLCTYPLPSDLFALAIHPTSPLLALGLASGHIQLNRLPETSSATTSNSLSPPPRPPARKKTASSTAVNTISTAWSTHRHKGSCRSLAFSQPDGSHLFSAGTDSLVKLADTETGRVITKIAVPNISHHQHHPGPDSPTLLHVFSPQCVLLATDSAALYLYDVRERTSSTTAAATLSSRPQQTYHPHADYVTSITTLPPPSTSSSTSNQSPTSTTTNNNNNSTHASSPSTQFLSTGGTTVAITDIRQGVLLQSEPQNEELLSSTLLYPTNHHHNNTKLNNNTNNDSSSSNDPLAIIGTSKGTLRIWRVGQWDDNEVEIPISPSGASVDVLAAVPPSSPNNNQGNEGSIAAGTDDGEIHFVQASHSKRATASVKASVLQDMTIRHDEIEGVGTLGFLNHPDSTTIGGSAGRRRRMMVSGGGSVVKIWGERGIGDADEEDVEEEVEEIRGVNGTREEDDDDDDDDDDDEDEDEDSDEGPKSKRRKKRKRGKGRGFDDAKKQVMRFKGLD